MKKSQIAGILFGVAMGVLFSVSMGTVGFALGASFASLGMVMFEGLDDPPDNLKEMIAAPDGVHLSAGNGYGAWVTYLRNHAKYSASNPWIMGSAYSAE